VWLVECFAASRARRTGRRASISWADSRDLVADLLAQVLLPFEPATATGVVGTFTSLSAISQDLPA
jgi:hypothetical protein